MKTNFDGMPNLVSLYQITHFDALSNPLGQCSYLNSLLAFISSFKPSPIGAKNGISLVAIGYCMKK